MAVMANRRSVMTLFAVPGDMRCHRVRIVLAEKGINVEIVDVDRDNPPEDLTDLNPYGSVPTLVDRDLVLFEDQVISEYLDERFPHPPLMPVDPVSRAKGRQLRHRIRRDWERLVDDIELRGEKTAARARKELRESLVSVAPLFGSMPYFLSEEYSLVDADMAALLWRLPGLGIELPEAAAPLRDYAGRIFNRPTFKESLDPTEM